MFFSWFCSPFSFEYVFFVLVFVVFVFLFLCVVSFYFSSGSFSFPGIKKPGAFLIKLPDKWHSFMWCRSTSGPKAARGNRNSRSVHITCPGVQHSTTHAHICLSICRIFHFPRLLFFCDVVTLSLLTYYVNRFFKLFFFSSKERCRSPGSP